MATSIQKPKWQNLAQGCCPKCNYGLEAVIDVNPLYPGSDITMLVCQNPGFLTEDGRACGFRIKETRAKEIVASLSGIRSRLSVPEHSEEWNLVALNNL